MIKRLAYVGVGAALAVAFAIFAQQSGSGLPGGAVNSTQYKISATAFGGVGPGSAGQVLTSNGAGMAPSFQAGGAALTSTQVGYGSAGNTVTGEAAFNYNATTNTLAVDNITVATACSGCGATETSGTFEATYTTMCTTTPSQTWNWVKIGNMVTLTMVDDFTCTSDSTAFQSDTDTIPAAIRPASGRNLGFVATVDNTTTIDNTSCIKINTGSNRFDVFRAQSSVPCDANTWSNTNTKGFINDMAGISFTYSLL